MSSNTNTSQNQRSRAHTMRGQQPPQVPVAENNVHRPSPLSTPDLVLQAAKNSNNNNKNNSDNQRHNHHRSNSSPKNNNNNNNNKPSASPTTAKTNFSGDSSLNPSLGSSFVVPSGNNKNSPSFVTTTATNNNNGVISSIAVQGRKTAANSGSTIGGRGSFIIPAPKQNRKASFLDDNNTLNLETKLLDRKGSRSNSGSRKGSAVVSGNEQDGDQQQRRKRGSTTASVRKANENRHEKHQHELLTFPQQNWRITMRSIFYPGLRREELQLKALRGEILTEHLQQEKEKDSKNNDNKPDEVSNKMATSEDKKTSNTEQNNNKTNNSNDKKTETLVNEKDPKSDKKTSDDVKSNNNSSPQEQTKQKIEPSPLDDNKPKKVYKADELAPLHPMVAHWFENIMYCVIVLNIVVLGTTDPYELRTDKKMQDGSGLSVLKTTNIAVAAALCFEQLIFGVALGFNKLLKVRQFLQLVVVIAASISLVVDVSGGYPNRYFGGSVVLILRLIRPLRHFAVFERLAVLTEAITGTISKLFDVTFLFMLFLVVAAVSLVSFAGGALQHRCVNDDYWNISTRNAWNFSVAAKTAGQPMIDFVCGGAYDVVLANQYWSLSSSTMDMRDVSRYCNGHRSDDLDRIVEWVTVPVFNATSNTTKMVHKKLVTCNAPPNPQDQIAPLFRPDGSSSGCSPDQVCDPGKQRFLGVSFGFQCPFHYTCDLVQNPRNGWAGFDNFGMALQSMFVSATWQTWFDLATSAADATNVSLMLYFVAFIWFADMLTGLILVKISLAFEQASQKAQRSWHELRERQQQDERRRQELTGESSASLISSIKSLAAAVVVQKKTEDKFKQKEELSLDTYLTTGKVSESTVAEVAKQQQKRPASLSIAVGNKNVDGDEKDNKKNNNNNNRAASAPAAAATGAKKSAVLPRKNTLSKLKNAALAVGQEALKEKQKQREQEELRQKSFITRNTQIASLFLTDLEIRSRSWRMTLAKNILCTKPYFFFIAFVNTANVIIIAFYQKTMSSFVTKLYFYGDLFCLVFLTFDVVLRITVMAPTTFMKSSVKNHVDFVVTVLSWIDVALNVQNMKAVRILRALRPIELLAYSPNLYKWVKFAMVAVQASPVVLFVLFCVMVVFALAGMQLLGGTFCGLGTSGIVVPDNAGGRCGSEGPRPRAHFDDFGHALLTSFQIVTGDNWDDVMWNAMTTRGWWMGIFFSVYYFFGAYMMLALLQGIIFSSFAQQSLKEDVARRARANAISPTGRRAIDASGNNNNNNNNNNKDDDQTTGTVVHIKSEVEKELDTVEGENDAVGTVTANPLSPNNQINFNLVGATEFVKTFLAGKGVQLSMFRKKKSFLENSLSSSDDDDNDDDQEENGDAETSSNGDNDDEKKEQDNDDVDKSKKKSKKIKKGRGKSASPKNSLNSDDLDSLFGADRQKTWKDVREEYLQPIARHKYTENFILLVILGSIVANVVTDPTNAPDSPEARNAFILELVTRALFFVEAVFMILAYGIDPRDPQSYLRRTGWHVFEFIITIANVVSIFLSFTVESDHPAVLFFSTFIAIRPLRIVRKSGSMSLVLRALGSALLSMRHAIMVIFILIILYAIAGTQVFAGKFDACIGNMTLDRDACLANGYDFNNQVPSFDNAFESLFSVFNILTLELWSEMMYTAMDITQRNKAPVPNANAAAALYFVFFAVIGGWFCVSIFMSVLVDSYNRCKRTESAQRSILIDREQNGWLKSNLYLVRALPNHALLHEHRHPSLFSNVKNNVVVFSDSDDDEDENKMGKANMNMIGPDGTGDAELDMILNDSFTNNNNKRRRRGSTKKSRLQALGLAENIDEDLDELLGTLATTSSNNNNNNTDSNINNNTKLQKNQKHPADITFGQFLLGKIRGVYGDFTATLDRSPTYRHVQKQFGDIVRAPWFVLACNVISVANFLLLCVQIFPTPDMYGQVLETLQDVLAVLFGLEAFCKILGESFAVYITSKWNKFDFFVAATSIIGLMFRSIIDSRIRSALWSIRLIRIVKIFRGRKSLATLVSHFGVALTSLAGVFSIILIFFFAFAVFSSQLFGKVIQHEDIDGSSDSISRHANFAKVPMAMYTLVRIAFMGDWPHLYWGMKKNSPGCEPRLGNCGPATPIPQAFFVCSIIFCTYVCRNLVLAVLIDSFSSAGDIRSIQKWQAKAIVKAWKCHDPEFTGVMRGFDVIHVLRKIPIWCTLGFRHFAHSNRIQLEMAFLTLLNVDDPNANNFAFIQKRREEAQAQVQSIGSIMLQQQQHQQQLNKNNNKSPSSPTALKTANSISSPTSNNNAASSPPSSPKIKPINNINDSSFATSPLVISAEARQRLSHGGVTFENFVDVLCHMSFNCPAPQKRSLKMHRMYEKDHVGESGDPLEAPDQMAYENAVRIIFNAAMKRLIARRRKRLRAASFARKKGRLEAGLAHLRKNNNNGNNNKNGDDDAADSDFDMMMTGDPSGSAPSSPTRKPKLVSHSTNAAEELAKKVMSGGSTLGETVSWLFEKVKGIAKSMTTDFTRPTAKDEFGVALSDDDEDDDDAKKMALDAAFDEDALNDDVEKKLEDATYEDWDFCETSDWHLRSERSRAKTTKHAVTHSWFTMKGDEGMKLLQGTPPPDEPLDDVELLPISKKDFEAFSLV